MNFKTFYILIFAAFWSLSLCAQSINPFDIKSRLSNDSPEAKNKVVSNEQTADQPADKNAFEINAGSEISQTTKQKEIQRGNPFDILPREKTKKQAIVTKDKGVVSPQKTGRLLKSAENKASNSEKSNFLFWLILLAFLLLSVSLSLDRWYITKIFKSVLNFNLANTLMRESRGFKLIVLSILYLLFILSASIFIFLLLRYFTGKSSLLFYWYSLGALIIIYTIRHISMRLLRVIFPKLLELNQYNYSILTFNIALGIILLFPGLLLAFSSSSLATLAAIFGIIMIAVFYLLRSFRGLLLSFNYFISNPFHFFLYLCAFEIAPVMGIYKLIFDFV